MEKASPRNSIYYFLIITFILLGGFLFFQVVMDDAYIPFRYGYNLVHHGTWNFFPGKRELVEAYTTFSYAALSIVPALLDIHPYIVFKIVGVLFFFAIIFLLYRSAENKRAGLFAILIFTANWQTYVHTYSGLETICWFFLFLRVIFLLSEDISSRKQVYLWILCLLLPMTRPEGILVGAFAFVYLAFIKKVRINYIALIACAIIGITYFILRYVYFDTFLPLPYYQKSVKNNIAIVYLFVNTWGAIHYIAAVILFAVVIRSRYFRWLAGFSLLLFFAVYSTSLLTMNFADRFTYQLFFPVLLYGIVTAGNAGEMQIMKLKYCAVFLVIFTFAEGVYKKHAKDFSSFGDNLLSGYYYSRMHLNLAMEFRKLDKPDMKVFCNEAGIFPYYSNIDYYDTEGLADKHLSTHNITPAYIEKINPDVFLYLIAIPKQEVENWLAEMGPRHPLNYYKYLMGSDKYEKIGYVVCIEYNVYIGVAVNRESKYYEEICKAGRNAILASEKNKFNVRKFLKFRYYNSYPAI